MRAGLTETEIRGALTVGVAKAGKNPKAASRALAALAVVAAANAKSELSEEDRLTLVTDLIASDLSESQFESMVAAKQASKSQGRQESSRTSESGPTSESNRGQSEQHQPGQSNTTTQGNENKQDDRGGQSQESHGKNKKLLSVQPNPSLRRPLCEQQKPSREEGYENIKKSDCASYGGRYAPRRNHWCFCAGLRPEGRLACHDSGV